jgi:hypothetical protein
MAKEIVCQAPTSIRLMLHREPVADDIYARTSGFSSMGVATKQTRQSCTVHIPGSNAMAAGVWHLTVIANGIASAAAEVTVT